MRSRVLCSPPPRSKGVRMGAGLGEHIRAFHEGERWTFWRWALVRGRGGLCFGRRRRSCPFGGSGRRLRDGGWGPKARGGEPQVGRNACLDGIAIVHEDCNETAKDVLRQVSE
jgi:hypothetical protein